MIAQKSETGYTEYEIPGVGWVSPTGSGYTTTYTLANQRGDTVGLAVGSTLTNIRDYDAYGGFYTLLASSDSDHRYVGSKGVIWNNASQTYTMGLREYSPYLGRFLNQDPVGYKGGINLYTYCGNEPVMRVDPSGRQSDQMRSYFNSWTGENFALGFQRWVADLLPNPGMNESWRSAFSVANDFYLGVGPDRIEYRSGASWDAMRKSAGFDRVISYMNRVNWLKGRGPVENGGISSPTALFDTILEPWNGTQAQVGAFNWTAYRTGNMIEIKIINEVSASSLFYHAPGVENTACTGAPGEFFSTVRQVFYYRYEVSGK